jgi:hypothetical protein
MGLADLGSWPPIFGLIVSNPQFMTVDPDPGQGAHGVGTGGCFGAKGIVDLTLCQQDIGQTHLAESLPTPDLL